MARVARCPVKRILASNLPWQRFHEGGHGKVMSERIQLCLYFHVSSLVVRCTEVTSCVSDIVVVTHRSFRQLLASQDHSQRLGLPGHVAHPIAASINRQQDEADELSICLEALRESFGLQRGGVPQERSVVGTSSEGLWH